MTTLGAVGAPTTPARAKRAADDDRLWRWTSFGPALLLTLAIGTLPLLNLFVTSFFTVSWSGGRSTWTPVGLANYAQLPSDPLLQAGITNTTIFAFSAVVSQMVLGFLLALLVSRIPRGQILFRAIFILPILIPGIVIGAIWQLLLNLDFGLVNQLLGLVGLGPHDWLGDPRTALLSVIVVDIWHWTPFCFLLLLAGIESLPEDVFEASKMDGASALQELWNITLPLMLPTILVTLAFRLVLAFKVFDEVFLLTGGGPGTATEVISFTIYQRFFSEDRVGYGSAMSVVVIFVISLLLVLALSSRRWATPR
ncbi:MAG TPA: sugar ABC transporter permease [Devosiaceae bacterium]|jgi:multiple sugar transport system permease protein|nr:sugar ABC transporter permease [Devosiaceae bacterium]